MNRNSKLSNRINLKHRPDYLVTIAVIGILTIGIIMLYSLGNIITYNQSSGKVISNSYLFTQLAAIGIGIFLWFILSKINYRVLFKLAPVTFGFSMLLMLITRIPALQYTDRGYRWIKLGSFSFQPVELLKISLICFFAYLIYKHKQWDSAGNWKFLLKVFLTLVICGGLTAIFQKDLGSAIVVVSILLAMYFVSQAKLRFFMLLLLIVFAGAIISIAVEPYRMQRIATYISHLQTGQESSNTEEELSAEDYHVEQAVITLGSGGFLGRGLGKSYQTYGYLPQPADDSIFVVIGEQMGLIGSLMLLSLYSLLIYRLVKIGFRSDSLEGRVISIGIATWITVQVFVNIGAMIKLIPLTGVTLPLVSYGGSSMMLILAAIGLSQSVSKFTLPKNYINYQKRIK